jgi:hypothetical protein
LRDCEFTIGKWNRVFPCYTGANLEREDHYVSFGGFVDYQDGGSSTFMNTKYTAILLILMSGFVSKGTLALIYISTKCYYSQLDLIQCTIF